MAFAVALPVGVDVPMAFTVTPPTMGVMTPHPDNRHHSAVNWICAPTDVNEEIVELFPEPLSVGTGLRNEVIE